VTIRVNGEEYASWDEVPEHARHLLEKVLPDADHNGVPDVFEGKSEPGHQTYRARFVATERTTETRVPGSGTRPGFGFKMTDSEVHQVAPDPEDRPSAPAAPVAPVDGPIVLNGVAVGPDGQPLRKKRWWNRGLRQSSAPR
jgi:hypothetical protein